MNLKWWDEDGLTTTVVVKKIEGETVTFIKSHDDHAMVTLTTKDEVENMGHFLLECAAKLMKVSE